MANNLMYPLVSVEGGPFCGFHWGCPDGYTVREPWNLRIRVDVLPDERGGDTRARCPVCGGYLDEPAGTACGKHHYGTYC